MEQDRMTGFMVGSDLLLFLRNHLALFLSTDAHFDKSTFDIRLKDKSSALSGCFDGSFIQKVLKVRTCKSCGCSGDLSQVYILTKRFVLGMDAENFLPALHIRTSHCNLTVKTSRTQDRRVKDIYTVGRCHHDDSLIDTETIHLHKELVKGLLSLIVAAAHTGTTLSGNCIDLIDKDDTRCMAFAFLKKVTHTGSTDTDKHFHEVRTGNGEERNACFSCHCFGKKGLTGSRRAYKQHTFRDSGTYFCIFLRRFQEVYDFDQIFFLLLKSGYIVKCHFLIIIRG